MLLLGSARLPGGERLAVALNDSAQQWFGDSFEQKLGEQLSKVRQPELRPMLMQLIMMHIAKDARLARQEIIGANPPIGWTVPTPQYAMQASKAVNSIRAGEIVTVRPGGSTIASESSLLNGWAALGFFLLAVFWVTLRRA